MSFGLRQLGNPGIEIRKPVSDFDSLGCFTDLLYLHVFLFSIFAIGICLCVLCPFGYGCQVLWVIQLGDAGSELASIKVQVPRYVVISIL